MVILCILLIIFGIGCYFGQYLPLEWRRPLSIVLLVLVLITVLFNRARRYGIVISHIYAIVVGLLSYATFTAYLQNLGPEVFIKCDSCNCSIYCIWIDRVLPHRQCCEYG